MASSAAVCPILQCDRHEMNHTQIQYSWCNKDKRQQIEKLLWKVTCIKLVTKPADAVNGQQDSSTLCMVPICGLY